MSLSDELLQRCLLFSDLLQLPSCSAVSRQWQLEASAVFAPLLVWRNTGVSCTSVLIPSWPSVKTCGGIRRSCGSIAELDDGAFSLMVAAPADRAVRTFRIDVSETDRQSEVLELEARRWPYRFVTGGSGGMVAHGAQAITFFPASTVGGVPSNTICTVDKRSWKNILCCGDQVFLLHESTWWKDEQLLADVVDMHRNTWVKIEVTPLRDQISALFEAGEHIERQAVSATSDHFIFHLKTTHAMMVGALRLPSAAHGAASPSLAEWATASVSFAKRWPIGHPMAELNEPNEMPVDDSLLLHGSWERSGLLVCLVHSANGDVVSCQLKPPAESGLAYRSFSGGGIGSLSLSIATGLVCACGSAQRGLPPPPIVIWDLLTGIVISECDGIGAAPTLSQPLPALGSTEALESDDEDGPLGDHGLRFGVGKRVECNTVDGWVSGRIIALNYREDDWEPGVHAPYQIRCEDGALIFAPADVPQLVRKNSSIYDQSFQAQVVLSPKRGTVLVGLLHELNEDGKVYLYDFRHDSSS